MTSKSHVDKAKSFLQDSTPRLLLRRTSSDSKSLSSKNRIPSGYKSAPENLKFGQDFPHLKILRGICQLTIGGNSKRCESPKYSSLYGPQYDLKETTDNRLGSEEIEQGSISQTGSCPSLLDNVKSGRPFAVNDRHLRLSLRRQDYGSASGHRDDKLQQRDVNLCDLKVDDKQFAILQKHEVIDINSENDCLSLSSNSVNSCTKSDKLRLGMPSKQSLDDLISFHTEKGSYITTKETNKCRMKIGLRYFRSTRQLRIMLHTVEGLKESDCDILVKLALICDTSKQKTLTRRLHISCTKEDLNEIVYMEPHDGKIIGKLLRLRLCKVSKYLRRSQLIGEAGIALDDLEISMDTSIWLTLNKQLSPEKQLSKYEVDIVSEQSDVQASERVMQGHPLAPADIHLLIASSHAHHRAKFCQ